jgi:hypothetical protein
MSTLAAKLSAAPPLNPAHEELAIRLGETLGAQPAVAGGIFRNLLNQTGAGFVRVALWVVSHPAELAAIVAEAAAGQYGKAFEDAVSAIRGAIS